MGSHGPRSASLTAARRYSLQAAYWQQRSSLLLRICIEDMFRAAYEIAKQQRLWLSSALIVALVLIFLEGAPIVPVAVGCIFAVGIAVFRSKSRLNR